MLPATPFQYNRSKQLRIKKAIALIGLISFFLFIGGAVALTNQLGIFRGDFRQRAAGNSCGCEGGNYVCHYSWGGSDSWPRDSCKQQSQPTKAPAQQSGSSGGSNGGVGGGTSGGTTGSGGSTKGLPNSQSSGCCSSNGECTGWFGAGSTCSNSNGACASGTQCKGGAGAASCGETCAGKSCGTVICKGTSYEQTCNATCQTKCGNGVCENGETNANCPADCTASTGGIGGGTGGTSNGMAYCAGNINGYRAIVNCTCTDWIRDGKDSSGNPCKTSVSTTPTPTLGNTCTGGDSYCSGHKAGQSCGNGGTCSVSEQIASGGVNCECTGQTTTSKCTNGGICNGASPGSKCGSGTCYADTGTATGYNCHCTDPNAGAAASGGGSAGFGGASPTPSLPSGVATPNLSPTASTPTPTRPICPTPPKCTSPSYQVMQHRSQGDWDCTTYTCAWPTSTPQAVATPYQCPPRANCNSNQILIRTGPDIHGCYIEGCVDKASPTPTAPPASQCHDGDKNRSGNMIQDCIVDNIIDGAGHWGTPYTDPKATPIPVTPPSGTITPIPLATKATTPSPVPSVTKAPQSSSFGGAQSQSGNSGYKGTPSAPTSATPTATATPKAASTPAMPTANTPGCSALCQYNTICAKTIPGYCAGDGMVCCSEIKSLDPGNTPH